MAGIGYQRTAPYRVLVTMTGIERAVLQDICAVYWVNVREY